METFSLPGAVPITIPEDVENEAVCQQPGAVAMTKCKRCDQPGTITDPESGPLDITLCDEHWRVVMDAREAREARWSRMLWRPTVPGCSCPGCRGLTGHWDGWGR